MISRSGSGARPRLCRVSSCSTASTKLLSARPIIAFLHTEGTRLCKPTPNLSFSTQKKQNPHPHVLYTHPGCTVPLLLRSCPCAAVTLLRGTPKPPPVGAAPATGRMRPPGAASQPGHHVLCGKGQPRSYKEHQPAMSPSFIRR